MSQETSKWLNSMILVGQTLKRGRAWHYKESDQGEESNHYTGSIPVADVLRRLFNFQAVERDLLTAPDLSPVEGWKAITASDNGHVFAIPKPGYQIHQYGEWLLGNIANLLGDSIDGVGIGTAGLLKERGVAFVQVEIPETITTPSGVKFFPFLACATSHDMTLATVYKTGTTQWVCDNTMAQGLAEAGRKVRIKHTANSFLRINDAQQVLGILERTADEFTQSVESLLAQKVTDREWNKVIDALVPLPDTPGRGMTMAVNKRDALQRLYVSDVRAATWHGTAFGALSAWNTYNSHEAIVRGASRAERKMLNDLTGATQQSDAEFLRALDLVAA